MSRPKVTFREHFLVLARGGVRVRVRIIENVQAQRQIQDTKSCRTDQAGTARVSAQRLGGKTVVLTGGCGALGCAIARRLAADGADVILSDILDVVTGQQRAAETGAHGYYVCDQTDRATMDRMLASVQRRYGRLDIIIANAAMAKVYPFADVPNEYWEATLKLNLTGYFHAAQSAVRLFQKQSRDRCGIRGRVLMTSSWVGQNPLPRGIAYVVTKAGVDAMVKALAQELGPDGIRVNAVAPGLIFSGLTRQACEEHLGLTEHLLRLTPLAEWGTPDQVGAAFAFLSSDDATYMTGHVLVVDGGCSVQSPSFSEPDRRTGDTCEQTNRQMPPNPEQTLNPQIA
jgi:NAD(P)-dependent dehydrogenase (short-subunit alcohol dehydrogenase family)